MNNIEGGLFWCGGREGLERVGQYSTLEWKCHKDRARCLRDSWLRQTLSLAHWVAKKPILIEGVNEKSVFMSRKPREVTGCNTLISGELLWEDRT